MEIRKVLALRGPNIWANFPVLEAWVDLKEFDASTSDQLPGFNDRLTTWLPSMVEHRCSLGQRGGFFERLRRGTYLAHVLEHVTLELQTLAGTPVGFGRARQTSEPGIYKVAIEYKEEELARACLAAAHELCMAAIAGQAYDLEGAVKRLESLAHDICLGPSTASIARAAAERDIPVRRLSAGSLVQLGYGAKQRRICTAETDRTSAIAESIAQDKDLTRSLLAQIGVPVPKGRPVENADDAWEAAQEIGVPVVVKPRYGNQGRGVITNLTTEAQVRAAFDAAREEGTSIMVEQFAPGADYRVLVIGDKMVAAARREPAHVIGDGHSTIRELVDIVNRDPRRSDDHATVLTTIKLDTIALTLLEEQGYTPDSAPAAGERVLIRRNANLSTGGTAADVTDVVHPEVAARAVDAAKMVGLDIAGVDIVATDISRPLDEQKGVIVEVNAGPGLRMHLQPSSGIPRPVGDAIVDSLFPNGQNGRIPIVAVTGVNGKTTTTRFIAHILRSQGRKVGMTCTDGIFVDERRIDTGDCSGPASATAILANPTVEAAVLETARGGILRAGLGFDECDVAVVTNIGEGDHLGLSDIGTLEKLAVVKRTIVDAVSRKGAAVLKANDPLVASMARQCRADVIFFAIRADDAVIAKHRRAGGRAVFVRHGMIVVAEGEVEIPLVPLEHVPLTHGGRILFQIENTLAAAAAAWALGIPRDAIRAGLETFAADLEKVPGRFNLLEIRGATVVVDYGHNVSALAALTEALEQFPHERRTIVYSAAGDRRDCDLVRQGELLGGAFDRVILYEDHYLRGRAEGEIMAFFRQGLATAERVTSVQEFKGNIRAIDSALRHTQPGDLLVIQADMIDETMDFLHKYLATKGAGHEIDLTEALEAPVAEPASDSVLARIMD
ncbi:MAG TPA: cyanophycin synthetase [Pirellulales bacterium]|jgi:cyanophycin synthetase|nr:cyanophycin synthetase [Pirellulales bacterium]